MTETMTDSAMLDTSPQAAENTAPAEDSVIAEEGLAEETTVTRVRQLTPEQHQQKLLRDRARRAAKKEAKEAAAELAAIPTGELTQEQRDQPYRDRLSAAIKASDAARAQRIHESQQRRAASKHNVAFR